MRVIPCRDYIIVAFLRMLYAIAFNIFPLIVWFFLKSISTSSEISYEATLPFVIGISVVVFTITLWSNHGSFKAEIISTKLKVATIGLVYKKASAVHLFWNCSSKGMVILCTCLDNLVIFLNFWYPASKAKLKTRKTVSAKKCSECEERERERAGKRLDFILLQRAASGEVIIARISLTVESLVVLVVNPLFFQQASWTIFFFDSLVSISTLSTTSNTS